MGVYQYKTEYNIVSLDTLKQDFPMTNLCLMFYINQMFTTMIFLISFNKFRGKSPVFHPENWHRKNMEGSNQCWILHYWVLREDDDIYIPSYYLCFLHKFHCWADAWYSSETFKSKFISYWFSILRSPWGLGDRQARTYNSPRWCLWFPFLNAWGRLPCLG